ncbi:TMEM147 [Cordylochernes scorpioides]|uniref:BOS complex subunit TMEM147 n=1 Tax=Cordylochernes scorpioides TaxID=51811 RepID=A0ABY6K299_9ARAC|nr:TMEM147 [Cordylochernes scorpioides]
MTLFHFGNCLALAYGPYFMTYKFSGLAEYGVFWKCIQAGAMYLLTQLVKMLILASFFPASDYGALNLASEVMKCSVDMCDLIGLYLVMSRVAGKGDTKFLVAGLGWATAELAVTRFLPLWLGARGVEFDWKYLQMSFDSNINLIHHISTAMLVWLWGRYDLRKSHRAVVTCLLFIACFRPLIIDITTLSTAMGPWSLLLAKLVVTSLVGLVAMHMYLTQASY